MYSGNIIADNLDAAREKAGACSLCGGIMYPITFCEVFKDTCDMKCEDYKSCKKDISAWKCKSCSHVERE